MLHLLRALTASQRNGVLAIYLGWTVDAFDFFILVFVMDDIAEEFGSEVKAVTFAIFLTLAARPFGAFVRRRKVHNFRPTLPKSSLASYTLAAAGRSF